jgi:hypothetical protein
MGGARPPANKVVPPADARVQVIRGRGRDASGHRELAEKIKKGQFRVEGLTGKL